MRVVFLGTPAFAVPSLKALLENSYEICGVFTQPDRPSGRGHKVQPSPVKTFARVHGLPVFQPDRIRSEENRAIVADLQPDFVVVAAYGQILPGWLLRSARILPVNVHASLLPRYRGAAPIPRAILNGDAVTGITIMVVEETLDTGAMLLQKEVPIPLTMTAGELADVLSEVGAELLVRALDGLQAGAVKPIPQDESQASWAPRIAKESAAVSWEQSSLQIHNQIRGLNPWPAASAVLRDERLRVWRSLPSEPEAGAQAAPGTFLGLTREGIRVQCGGHTVLEILEVQRPAKGRVSGREFASGARLCAGERFA